MIPVSVDSGHLVLCLSRIRPVDLIHRKHLKMKVGGGGKKEVVLDVAFSISVRNCTRSVQVLCGNIRWG